MASERLLACGLLVGVGCAEPATPPPAPRPATTSALADALRRLGRALHGTVVVRANVAGATVALDGRPVRLDEDELVDVLGPHELVVEAAGYATQRSTITVGSAQRREVFVALDRPGKRKGGGEHPDRPSSGLPSSTVAPLPPRVPVGKDDAVDPFAP